MTKRTRLTPQARRNQLLDVAALVIQDKGIRNVTMEAVAVRAQVSYPLVYKYFDSRLTLLQDLLNREYSQYVSRVRNALAKVCTFEEAVDVAVRINFEEFSTGDLLDTLRSQPDIREGMLEFEQQEARLIGRFFIDLVMQTFGVDERDACSVVVLGTGAAKAAAKRYRVRGGDKDAMISKTLSFIHAGVDALIEQGAAVSSPT